MSELLADGQLCVKPILLLGASGNRQRCGGTIRYIMENRDIKKAFFNNWRRYRGEELGRRKPVTLEEIGAATGLSVGFLSQLGSGKRGGSLETWKAIAAVLGCTVDDLDRDPRQESVVREAVSVLRSLSPAGQAQALDQILTVKKHDRR